MSGDISLSLFFFTDNFVNYTVQYTQFAYYNKIKKKPLCHTLSYIRNMPYGINPKITVYATNWESILKVQMCCMKPAKQFRSDSYSSNFYLRFEIRIWKYMQNPIKIPQWNIFRFILLQKNSRKNIANSQINTHENKEENVGVLVNISIFILWIRSQIAL